MDKVVKRELWKIFSVASFLFITIFFILPYLVQVSTYFHEKGHVKYLTKYDVENEYKMNLLETIPNFYNPRVEKLGVTKFNLQQYKALGKQERFEINIAGIISDLRFLFLIGIYLTFSNIFLFYKVKIKQDYDFIWVLGINWILFMWLLALIQISVANISSQGGDIWYLVSLL